MRRRRALGALVLAASTATLATGCLGGGGGDDASDLPPAATAPAAAAPVAVAAVEPGGVVSAGPETPKAVAKALAGSKVVVVAFLVKGPADDAKVAAALRAVRAERAGRTAAQFFVYTVGKDRFGDLADRLGVAGTPAVAVIGRDRTLVNLWTGLSDAEILRQSISDAADTAAANRGAAAGATTATSGITGNPTGIALAERANAAYANVPGLKVAGTFAVEGAGTMQMEGTLAMAKGAVTGVAGTFSLAGARFEMVATPSSASVTTSGAGCWARVPGGSASGAATPDPAVALAPGTRVSAPRIEGANRLIDVTAGGETATYVIGRSDGRLRAVRTAAGTLTFAALAKTPSLPDPSPVCDDPSDALKGLPAALGGTA